MHNSVHLYVMRLVRNLGESLELKTDADLEGRTRDRGEKSVVESRASTESGSFSRESQTGHHDEVQLLNSWALSRLAYSKSSGYKFREGQDLLERESVAFAPWIADQMRIEQAAFPQKIQVRLSKRRRKQGETLLAGEEGG
jgi:hypothetical protein